MSDDQTKLVSRVGILVDLGLTAVFFLFMWVVLGPHVPSDDPSTISWVAAYTSLCLTGVFWLAVSMFRITLVDYLRAKK
ncbi:MAG: hypothetical protein CMI30_04995 [Opitutae bacterium]|nr:hypothetical protein [Opitutae bacterium]|tara:strand:+ start:3644 stop:3880 length:237 start_codon:yes stop_codon:yes gene_type:complete